MKTKYTRATGIFFTLLTSFGLLNSPAHASAEVPFSMENCQKVTSMSQGTAERISKKFKVSVKSISIFSIGISGTNGCKVNVDTADGIKTIFVYAEFSNNKILTDGDSFWIHWTGW